MHVITGFHKKYLFEKFDMVIKFAVNIKFLYESRACFLMNLFYWNRESLFHKIFNCHSFEFIYVWLSLSYLQLLC